jgi:putative transposase
MFVNMLEWKLEARGGELIRVPAPYASQKRPVRGHADSGDRKTQAEFKRLACGSAL